MTSRRVLSDSESAFKGFLACPISQYASAGRLDLPVEYERFIRSLFDIMRNSCDAVFLALEREDWGGNLLPGDVCTPLDFEEMRRCDVVVAYPGTSCGVAVELGWATAISKPLIMLLESGVQYSPMIRDLNSLPGAVVYTIVFEQVPGGVISTDVREVLVQALTEIRQAWRIRRMVYDVAVEAPSR